MKQTMVKLSVRRSTLTDVIADVVVYFVAEDKMIFKQQRGDLARRTKAASFPLERGMFTGKDLETLWLYPRKGKTKALLLVGLGKAEKLTLEQLRRAAATAARTAEKTKARSVAIMEPDSSVLEASKDFKPTSEQLWESIGFALGEGAALGVYKFHKYITQPEQKSSTLTSVLIVSEERKHIKELARGLHLAQVVCEATCFARDLSNAPGNEIYPESLAQRALAAGRRH